MKTRLRADFYRVRDMNVFLKTERLLLRRFTGADADDLYALDGDPEVVRFLDDGRPKTREVVENETLPGLLRQYERSERFGCWAAVERSTGGFVGWFALHPPEGAGPEEVELGYRMRRSAWGKGYATEGSRALIQKAFTELGVLRVYAETMAVNTVSRRVMEKAGLTLARTFHEEWSHPIEGAEHGEVGYALTKADWEKRARRGHPAGAESAITREGWNRAFSRPDGGRDLEDPWLERWRPLLETNRRAPVLDLGCGAGQDATFLTRLGLQVVAADFSEKALEVTHHRAPLVETRDVDLTRPLPFPDARFGAVVAGLSLHYFPWRQTLNILEEIRRCLVPGGHLLARLNSTRDAHYAGAEKEEIDPNFYPINGHPKRLFDHQDVLELFATGWNILEASERTTNKYGPEKTLWKVIVKKTKKR